MRSFLRIEAAVVVAVSLSTCLADVDPSQRTADMPDSWLVIYNLNDPDSIAWKDWYLYQRGIPPENALGLDVPTTEVVSPVVRTAIQSAVRAHLDANPTLEAKIMGFVVGFRVPLRDNVGNVGGHAVDGMLTDLNDLVREGNRHASDGFPRFDPPARLTKATMTLIAPHCYMVARIDGPSLEDAKDLTRRAQVIECLERCFSPDARVYYDYLDAVYGIWYQLQWVVGPPSALPEVPWAEFHSDHDPDSGVDILHDDVFRFAWWCLFGWHDERFGAPPSAGQRVLAFNCNSFGATTLRSTTGDYGRYVPNALWNGGYAAAIGATGEPGYGEWSNPGPYVKVMLLGLREGWTLGEAFYAALQHNDFKWIIVGDPLLRIPCWFGEDLPPGEPAGSACASVNTIEAARSCRQHGAEGQLCLDLSDVNIEPRQGGITNLELQMRIDVGSISATIEGGPYDGNVLLSTGPGANGPASKITISFDPPLPDQSCCLVSLGGDSRAVVVVRTLEGDVNRDGTVNPIDTSMIKLRFGQVAATAGPQWDFNGDGEVNPVDSNQILLRFGHSAPSCP